MREVCHAKFITSFLIELIILKMFNKLSVLPTLDFKVSTGSKFTYNISYLTNSSSNAFYWNL